MELSMGVPELPWNEYTIPKVATDVTITADDIKAAREWKCQSKHTQGRLESDEHMRNVSEKH